jgi:hypothetical protein
MTHPRWFDELPPEEQRAAVVDVLMILAVDRAGGLDALSTLTDGQDPTLHYDGATFELVWPNGLRSFAASDAVAAAVALRLERAEGRRMSLN